MQLEKLFNIQKELNKKYYNLELKEKYLNAYILILGVKWAELASDFIDFDYTLYRKNEYTLGQLINMLESLLKITIEFEDGESNVISELKLDDTLNLVDTETDIEYCLISVQNRLTDLYDNDVELLLGVWISFIELCLELQFSWKEIFNEYVDSRGYLLNL